MPFRSSLFSFPNTWYPGLPALAAIRMSSCQIRSLLATASSTITAVVVATSLSGVCPTSSLQTWTDQLAAGLSPWVLVGAEEVGICVQPDNNPPQFIGLQVHLIMSLVKQRQQPRCPCAEFPRHGPRRLPAIVLVLSAVVAGGTKVESVRAEVLVGVVPEETVLLPITASEIRWLVGLLPVTLHAVLFQHRLDQPRETDGITSGSLRPDL